MYWQPELETMSADNLRQLQLTKLKQVVDRAAQSPFYRNVFQQHGISSDKINSVDDIRRLPFTTKQDLRDQYPYGLLTVSKDECTRLHCSSGTTGNPTVIFHTKNDLNNWANLVARSLYCAGARKSDVFQNICGYGLFTGGLGFQYGAECLGALTIPAAAGNSKRQIKLMSDFKTTVIHTIPSYLVRLYDVFMEMGLDPRKDTDLRLLVIGAEPHTEEHRQRIQDLFGVKAYNSFGLSEMNGPGVAFECTYQNGLHIWEDAFIVEIVDPETFEPVPVGQQGELVMTSLDREAMPIIRYRTRDLTRLIPGKCECGRIHARLDRMAGRTDDMFIIKGCNVFPMQIEGVLMRIPEVGHDYVIELDTAGDVDELRIKVEVRKEWFTGDIEALERLSKRITHEVRDEILATPKVELVEPGSLPKAAGKAVRVIDLRKNKG